MRKELIFNRNLLTGILKNIDARKEHYTETYTKNLRSNIIFYTFEGNLSKHKLSSTDGLLNENEKLGFLILGKYDIDKNKTYLSFTFKKIDIFTHKFLEYIEICDDFMEFKTGKDIFDVLDRNCDKYGLSYIKQSLKDIVLSIADIIIKDSLDKPDFKSIISECK